MRGLRDQGGRWEGALRGSETCARRGPTVCRPPSVASTAPPASFCCIEESIAKSATPRLITSTRKYAPYNLGQQSDLNMYSFYARSGSTVLCAFCPSASVVETQGSALSLGAHSTAAMSPRAIRFTIFRKGR